MSHSRCMTQAIKNSHCVHSCCYPCHFEIPSLLPPSCLPHYAYSIMLTHTYTHIHTHRLPGLNAITFMTTGLGRITVGACAIHLLFASFLLMIAISTAEVAFPQCRRQPMCHHSCTRLPSLRVGVSLSLHVLPNLGEDHSTILILTCSSGALYKLRRYVHTLKVYLQYIDSDTIPFRSAS